MRVSLSISHRRPGPATGSSATTNGYESEVSADAAGIIATLFTLSHLSFKYESDLLPEGYGRLYAFASDHPEASEIFQAID